MHVSTVGSDTSIMMRESLVRRKVILVYGSWSFVTGRRSILISGRRGIMDNWGKWYFDNRLVSNKPGMDSTKVEKDLGMMRISLGSSFPHNKQQTHLLSSISKNPII